MIKYLIAFVGGVLLTIAVGAGVVDSVHRRNAELMMRSFLPPL